MRPDCAGGSHPFQFDGDEADDLGNPAPGIYRCTLCGIAFTIKEGGSWSYVQETAQGGRCGRCGKPIDDHGKHGASCGGLGDRPPV